MFGGSERKEYSKKRPTIVPCQTILRLIQAVCEYLFCNLHQVILFLPSNIDTTKATTPFCECDIIENLLQCFSFFFYCFLGNIKNGAFLKTSAISFSIKMIIIFMIVYPLWWSSARDCKRNYKICKRAWNSKNWQ